MLDHERQELAKKYARIRQRLLILDLGIGGAYLLAWLVFDWSSTLSTSLKEFSTNEWFLVAGFAAIFGGVYYLITLPLSLYESYILPHRFQLSNQTLKGWVGDQLKGLLIGGIIGLLIIEIIYALLRATPDTWWLWTGLFLLIFNVILASLAPILLFPLFFKFVPLGADYAELVQRLTQLAEKAGAHVQGVYKFDMSRRTKAANAALTGLGNTRRIILGDTLLIEFTLDEIETVLAHELGHHVHKDIPIGILVEAAITMTGLYLASLTMAWGVTTFGFSSIADVASMPLFGLVLAFYGLLTMPLINTFSRWREKKADEYAVEVTGKRQAFASALTRLANQNLADANPEPWIEYLLYSHPSISRRIKMVLNGPSDSKH